MAYTAVCSKAMVLLLLLLLIYCLTCYPLFVGILCLYLFCYVLLCVHSSFAIILKRKRKLVASIFDATYQMKDNDGQLKDLPSDTEETDLGVKQHGSMK